MHRVDSGYQNLLRRHRSDLLIITEILGLVRERGWVKKTHIMNAVNLNSSNAARYLQMLVKARLLREKREGREVHYSLTPLGSWAYRLARLLTELVYGGVERRRECGDVKKLLEDEGLMLQADVYLVSGAGLRYPVDYYVADAGTALIEVPEEDPELVQEVVHRVVSMALARPNGLERIVVVARNGYAQNIRAGINQLLARAANHAEVRVAGSCREAMEAVKEAFGVARLGPHTAPHRALGP